MDDRDLERLLYAVVYKVERDLERIQDGDDDMRRARAFHCIFSFLVQGYLVENLCPACLMGMVLGAVRLAQPDKVEAFLDGHGEASLPTVIH